MFATAVSTLGCRALLPVSSADSRSEPSACNQPEFPYRDGWLGADSAYSVPLDGDRTLWLFGDSFVGEQDATDRVGSKMVNNTIGLSRCLGEGRDRATFDIRYAWKRGSEPRAFVEHERPDRFYWLFDGFEVDDALFIGLVDVERTTPRGPMNFPFRFVGADLLRVDRHHERPERWETRRVPLTHHSDAVPGTWVAHQGALYFFSFFDTDAATHPRFLARLPLEALNRDLESLANSIETLGREGEWLPGFVPERAHILMHDNATEMSVHFDAMRERWVAIYSHPNVSGLFPHDPLSDAILMRTAARLEGPWSRARVVYRVPELAPDANGEPPANTVCYGAKAHEQFAAGDTIAVTYACNVYTPDGQDPWVLLRQLLVRMDLYQPQSVVLSLPD